MVVKKSAAESCLKLLNGANIVFGHLHRGRVSKRRRSISYRPSLEILEGRTLPTITASLDILAYGVNLATGDRNTDESTANPGSASASYQIDTANVSAQSSGSFEITPSSLSGNATINTNEAGSAPPFLAATGVVSFSGSITLSAPSTVTLGADLQCSLSPSTGNPVGAVLITFDSGSVLEANGNPGGGLAAVNNTHWSTSFALSGGTHLFSADITTTAATGDDSPTENCSLGFSITEVPQSSGGTGGGQGGGGDQGGQGGSGGGQPGQPPPPAPDVVVDSLSTEDSRILNVNYHVDFANVTAPLTINFYRSLTQQLDRQENLALGSITVDGSIGPHHACFELPGGLQPNTDLPYVLAIANPDNSVVETTTANDTAFFRTYVIGAVSIGFDFRSRYSSTPPSWANTMASDLVQVDHYIGPPLAFTWDSTVKDPQPIRDAGRAFYDSIAFEAASITNQLHLNDNDVIDVQMIGHSRGAVVVSEAMQSLINNAGNFPQLDHGYFKMTLLDPHPANNVFGFNASTTVLGLPLAGSYIDFQDVTIDPPVYVPARVNEVDDFYEKTPTTDLLDFILEGHFLNLNGLSTADVHVQDPTKTLVLARDLTGPGIGHSEVTDWYQTNVVDKGYLASDITPPGLVPPSNSLISTVLSGPQVSSLTSAGLQAVLATEPNPSILVASDTDLVCPTRPLPLFPA
jgi:hypothetical protein